MKSFHKNKFLLFVCMIVFLFQTGCTDASSISTTVAGTTQENTQDTEMDFTQIQAGDYSSLLGTWKEIAYADNRFDGTKRREKSQKVIALHVKQVGHLGTGQYSTVFNSATQRNRLVRQHMNPK